MDIQPLIDLCKIRLSEDKVGNASLMEDYLKVLQLQRATLVESYFALGRLIYILEKAEDKYDEVYDLSHEDKAQASRDLASTVRPTSEALHKRIVELDDEIERVEEIKNVHPDNLVKPE